MPALILGSAHANARSPLRARHGVKAQPASYPHQARLLTQSIGQLRISMKRKSLQSTFDLLLRMARLRLLETDEKGESEAKKAMKIPV
jgi:hypothetical protein